VSVSEDGQADGAFKYLENYNYYRHLIEIHNQRFPDDLIEPLKESFTLIGGYRNYNSFNPSVSLSTRATTQIQNIRRGEFLKSTNAHDQAEPSVFNVVRLRIAEVQQKLNMHGRKTVKEAEDAANQEPFLKLINNKLALINLRVDIKLTDVPSWSYSFHFRNLKSGNILSNINSLSAGQKSIIHLIFESYGRGDLKGGVVVIDEPEIHLHYQLQYEYLRIIEQLNAEQSCQYILVTHSEALISSATIDKVIRFTLDDDNSTRIMSPNITGDQKMLVKILDNTRSTYALFAKTVVLVEGDSDRYFFKAVMQELHPELSQEVAILDIGGKDGYPKWKEFFTNYGLKTFYIGDFDNVFNLKFGEATIVSTGLREASKALLIEEKLQRLEKNQLKRLSDAHATLVSDKDFLKLPPRSLWEKLVKIYSELTVIEKKKIIEKVMGAIPTIGIDIEKKYSDGVFILKKGSVEDYTGTPLHNLSELMIFCETLKLWLASDTEAVREIKKIVKNITTPPRSAPAALAAVA